MNPIGIHLSYWQEKWSDNLLPLINKAYKSGYDLAEFPLLFPQDLKYDLLRGVLNNLGMAASCSTGLNGQTDITHPSSAIRKAGIKHLHACIQGASMLGSPILAGLTYTGWGIFPKEDKTDRYKQCINSLRMVSKMADDYGITICLEVVNRFEGYLLNTVSQGLSFLDELKCSNVKLHLDTFHMNIEEDNIGAAILRAGPFLGHFHAVENNRQIPGTGHIPWQIVAESIASIDYKGYIVSETFITSSSEVGDGMNIWRSLPSDLDNAAQNGAIFLKRVFNHV
jgi:D-psicose/D-tagatose/L-ribulose 3-epimerase